MVFIIIHWTVFGPVIDETCMLYVSLQALAAADGGSDWRGKHPALGMGSKMESLSLVWSAPKDIPQTVLDRSQ
jgi:hypothetical protein